ncbi:MAG TPA: hypothetical protein VIN73_12550 [Vicingaceae bacterium]
MLDRFLLKIYLVLLLVFASSTVAYSQYNSEEELKKAADKFFAEENYIEALPLFSQLLSTYPKDLNYNYKYGACYLYATRDKEKAINYLSFAASRPNVDPLAYYYLAKAYHHNYEFASAIVYFNKYKGKTSSKEHQKYEIYRQIEMCKNGQQLLKKINKIGVISKKEIKESEFFRSYDLRGLQGKVIVKPDEFKMKVDKKENEYSILYSDPNLNVVVFSSYGDKGSNKDIYKIEKIGINQFSDPISLGDVINTPYDEDYAFLHPDGKTLYFSSKGHNSMGGYDIFKSIYDDASATWSAPVNLDFPINTPDDDILYISDIDNQLAYFASSRASKQNELTVYKVKVEPEPLHNPIIKGLFVSEENPSLKNATISIVDAMDNTKYGVYNTDENSGEYLLTFPADEKKYKLIVETTNEAPIHSAIIELPKMTEFKLLKQELLLVGTGDNEKLVIKNLFDQEDEFDISNPIIVQNLLKQQAKLDVNISEEDALKSINDASSTLAANETSSSEYADYSDDKLKAVASKKVNELLQKTKKSEEEKDFYFNYAATKTNEAKNQYNQDTKNKDVVAEDVNSASLALKLARVTQNEAVERNSDKPKLIEYQQKLEAAITSGNRSEAELIMAEIEKIEAAAYFETSAVDVETKLADEKLKTSKADYQKQRDIVIGYTNRKLELEKSIAAIESQIEETKKSKDKEALQDQLATYKIDLEDLEFQIEKSKAKELLAKQEFDKAKNEANLLANVVDAAKKQTTTSPSLDNQAILATESNIKFFEEEGVLGYYPATSSSPNTSVTSTSLVAMKDDYEIIDDNGNLIDYNTKYANQVDENDNNPTAIIDINKQWIAAIEEDIEIKNSLKNSAKTVGEKEELSKIVNQLETLKEQKQEEIDLQTNLALQNETNNNASSNENTVADNNNNTANTTTTSKTNTKKYETSIIDKDGNVINYNAQFLEELEQLPADEQTAKLFAQKAEIYNKWADATEQEITLKKIELVEADANEAPAIQEDLDELTSDLQGKQEFTALFLTQAKALAATEDELAYVEDIENKIAGNNIESNELASNETNNNNQNNTTSSNQKINAAKYNNITINNDGSVNDYATEYENQLAALELRSDNKVKISEEQVAVTTNWIEAIDEEIAYQNERLIATDDENEKATIENRIADLKEQKSTQIAQLNTFQTELIAVKSTSTNETTNEVVVNETTTSNTTAQNQVNKGNSSLTYNSTNAKNILANVDDLTAEVNALREKADNTEDEAYKTTNTTEKEEKLVEAEKINNAANDKEIEIATLYERANSTEFKDNQTTVNTLLKSIGGQSTDNNYIMAEMLNDESVTLFNEASDARQQAVATNNFKQKKDLLDEAAKLEKEAIEKQQNAIGLLEQISTSSSIAATNNNQNNTQEEVIAEETTTNNNQQTNNNTEEDIVAEETTTINNNQQTSNNNQSSANNRKSSTNNNQQQVTVYEPKNIALPSKERKQDAIQLEKEAITLNQEAKQLDETAENTKNRKEKQALVEEAQQKREEADRKAKEAEVIYAEVKEMEAEEELYLEELATQRKELVATVLTSEEENYVQSLTPEEKAAITNTPEFKEYKELKQSSRRLVKEAQVEYVAADKAKEEAEDQKQLGVALQALQQAAATEADKNKLANQMKKLDEMIAQNEQKAKELREQAAAKEQQALEENKKAKNMVANKDENSALGFVALEKTNDTSSDMLADYTNEVNSSLPENQRKQQANNKNEEDVLAEESSTTNNQQQTNNTEEDILTEETTTNNNQQSINNQSKTNNTEEDIVAEETTNNSQQSTTNNQQATNNNNQQATNNQQSIANIDEIPEELTESIFTITSPNESAYNENKRIPKNPKLPEGLVFKVQIGAFRNPIPQDHYKGFAPLMAEDAGNGITRYTAGLFKTFNVANMAKNEIRTMGYPDAFVVAFFNGKRININEARAMLNETSTTEEEISFTNTAKQTNNQQSSNNNQPTNNNTPINTEEVKDGISKDVRNIEGVFYTIQVGVYSKPITADQLNNLTPLNSERTANGLIRYTSGIYKNLNDANAAKNRAVNLGITDAFIIAYQNGNKITVAQANELLGSNNSSPANNNTTEVEVTNENTSSNNNTSGNNTSTSTVENENATSNTSSTTNENNEEPIETIETTNTNEATSETVEPINTNEEVVVAPKPKTDEELRQVAESLNIVFKVKIGEFTDEISNEDAAVLLKLSDRNIENFVDGDKTIYTIGNLLDYKSALNTQLEMKEMGVKSPSVVAFKNNTIIPVEEALELIKNVE